MANIVRRRRSGLVLRGGRDRRETSWVPFAFTSTVLAASTPVLFTGFSAGVLVLRPFTVTRLRGWMSLSSDQTTAQERYAAALGLAIVSDQALAVGVTAVPTPVAEADSDLWFLWQSLSGSMLAVTSTGLSDTQPTVVLDSRAMRKVEDGQDIAVVQEASGGSAGCVLQRSGRLLITLH